MTDEKLTCKDCLFEPTHGIGGCQNPENETKGKGKRPIKKQVTYDVPVCEKYKPKRPNDSNGNGESQATQLIGFVISPKIELFHDEKQEPYARIPISSQNQVLSIKGINFKRWLSRQFFMTNKTAVSNDAVNSALMFIESTACNDGNEYKLHNRVCEYDGAIWYDLGDWEAVKITKENWEIIKNPPILFKRYSHQKNNGINGINGTLRTPIEAAKKLLSFVRVSDEKDKLLFVVSVISYFIPDIPHVNLILHGEKGATKTTTHKLIKKLIDPSVLEILSLPKDKSEFIQQLDHHYYAPYDNISWLQDWHSDLFCRAITGEGSSKRGLYTNDEDFIYSFKRCVGLNGIDVAATKPDLLDRSILIKLERVPKNERKTEKEYWQEFDKVKPEIMRGIFTTISKAMVIYPTIQLDELPRMADFTLWGCAIAEALGYSKDKFLDAYNTNIEAQNMEAIEANSIGQLVILLMENKQEWKGTPSQLLLELKKQATLSLMDIKSKSFPKSAEAMSRRLNQIKGNLRDIGINFESAHDGTQRVITIVCSDNTVSTVIPLGSQSGNGENPNGTTNGIQNDAVSEEDKEMFERITNGTTNGNLTVKNEVPLGKNQDAEKGTNGINATNGILRTSFGDEGEDDFERDYS